MDPYFNEPEVTNLQVLLEEVTRAKPGLRQTRFIEPDSDSLLILESRFHHVLYGRRGTGKSSILRQVESKRRPSGHLVAWVDQEIFTGLSYPDVLVGTLAEVFRQFASQIRIKDIGPSRKGLLRKKVTSSNEILALSLDDAVRRLQNLKNSPNESEIAWSATFNDSSVSGSNQTLEGGVALKGIGAKINRKRTRETKISQGGELVTKYLATKKEHLERAVTTYRQLMLQVSEAFPDSFIILDDFYRLSEVDQPNIAGYFHRVVKDTSTWLKFGTIRFWTRLYAGGPTNVGLQAPHDIREISLDRGLLDFKNSKRFLESILKVLASDTGVDIEKLFTKGSFDRLVLAAGGVARDYIGLVNDAIRMAKQRTPSAKPGTQRVIVEDVNKAAGLTANQKLADLAEDAGGRAGTLQTLVIELTKHCRLTGSACFLVDVADLDLINKLGRLQNMRFIHLIDSNESLPDAQSSRYMVYLLDVSQLATQRAWKVDVMNWTKRSQRRARKLVFKSMGGLSTILPMPYSEDSSQEIPEIEDESAIVTEIESAKSLDYPSGTENL